ncbi:MAG TPA: HepT-like ribonuclease domain-containing protein [Planctomycetota bacterium]|nr:HepT-like ribonuclease domain-containing protein [Planctomycetota bacterium]
MRDPLERLRDVLEAIERIESHRPRTLDALVADELLQVWAVHHLRIIGEAVAAVPPEVRTRAADVPWTKIVGMRNVLVHEYFAVNVATVWSVLESDLAPLRDAVRRLLAELGSEA